MGLVAVARHLESVHDAFTASHFAGLVLQDVDGLELARCGTPVDAIEPDEAVFALEAYGAPLGVLRWQGRREAHSEAAEQSVREASRYLHQIATMDYEIDNLSHELAETYEAIHLLCDVSEAAVRTASVRDLCEVLLETLHRQIQCRGGLILLKDAKDHLKVEAVAGDVPRMSPGVRLEVPASLQRLMGEGLTLLVDEVESGTFDGDDALHGLARESLVAMPLLAGEVVHGVLILLDRQSGHQRFDSRDRKLVDAVATQGTAMILSMRSAEFAKELEIGRRIQQSLLPRRIPQIPTLEVAGMCSMAKVIGGDFYDAGVTEDGLYHGVIADVSGHDFGSALLMSSARAQFRSQLKTRADLAATLGELNASLHEDLSGAGLFLTCIFARFDPAQAQLQYCSGGHNPALLLRHGTGVPEELPATGMPLGVTDQAVFSQSTFDVEPGDLILLYTDGLTEATSPEGEMFGEERLAASLVRHRDLPVQEILSRLEQEIHDFIESDTMQDDGTALLMKVCPDDHPQIDGEKRSQA